ncbi:S9 family peptidase, partial [bacterium]|nr:S9 family peptidase [bacterium]
SMARRTPFPSGCPRSAAVAAALLAVSTLAGAPPAHAAVTFEDLVGLTEPSEVTVSRNGKMVAWAASSGDVEENKDVSRIRLWRQEGFADWNRLKRAVLGDESPRFYRTVTRADENASSPAFSGDGASLAFLAARGEDAEDQVWVLPLDGGEATAWTDAKGGVDQFAWRPDGGLVYLASVPWPEGILQWRKEREEAGFDGDEVGRNRRPKAFWIVPPGGGNARLAYRGGPGIEDFVLSWSGESVVFRDNGTGDPAHWNQINLFRVDLEPRTPHGRPPDKDAAAPLPVPLTTRWGDEWNPQWSNDDSAVYFLAGADSLLSFSEVRLFSVPADGGKPPRALFAGEVTDLDEIRTAPGEDRVYAVAIEGARTTLLKLFPNTESVQRLVDQPGRVAHIDVSNGGDDVVFVQEGPGQAPEVCRWQFNNKFFDRLTEDNAAVTAKADALHRIVSWKAEDGLEIEGILVTPPGADGPLPGIVMLHGGPASVAYDTVRWSAMDAFAGRGYAVFAPNFRGSQGYGAEFAVANYRDLGGADFADVMSGVDHLIAEGILDGNRLGVTGASYGGFLTNVAVTATDRFGAAVSELGMASLVTDFAQSEQRTFEHDYLGAWFWQEPDLYAALSPLTRVDRITTPLLLLHGADDTNTNPANSRELFHSMLETKGAPVEFVLYPREGHGFREPAHELDELRRMIGWFDRYLLDRGPRGIGSTVREGDWSLTVRGADVREEVGGSAGPWLVVDVVLASDAAVEGRPIALTGTEAAFVLLDADDRRVLPAAVPVDWNGAPHLVFGESHVTLAGDPAGDGAAWPFRVAFPLENAASPGRLRVLDLPEVQLDWPASPDAHPTEKPE